MTKKQLIEALKDFPDDATITVAFLWKDDTVVEGIADVVDSSYNGDRSCVQLSTDAMQEAAEAAYQEIKG